MKAVIEIEGQLEFLEDRKGFISFIVRSQGLKKVRLRLDDKVFDKKTIFVSTDEWWGSINLTVPLFDQSFIHDGVMQLLNDHLTPNSEEVYATFNLNRDFEVSADEMIFETTVQNSKEIGGFLAYDVSINLEGSKDIMSFNLLDTSAITYAKMKIALLSLDSPKERIDLKKKGVIMDEWVKVKVILRNHSAEIFLNEEKIFESK